MENLTLEDIEELPREYITVKEAAAVLGISTKMFYKHTDKMPFPIMRLCRNYRIPKQPFVEYVRTGRNIKNG